MNRDESVTLSNLLALGFVSDRLLIALDSGEVGTLKDKEAPALEELSSFLSFLVEYLVQPTALLGRTSTAYAIPQSGFADIGAAVHLKTGQVSTEAITYFKNLLKVVEQLLAGDVPSDASLKTLKQFLEGLASGTLNQVSVLRQSRDAERRQATESKWQLT